MKSEFNYYIMFPTGDAITIYADNDILNNIIFNDLNEVIQYIESLNKTNNISHRIIMSD